MIYELRYWIWIFGFIMPFCGLHGQTCCSAGAPLTSSFDIINLTDQRLALQLEYSFKNINRLTNERELLTNDPRNRSGSSLLFKTDIKLDRKWAVSIIFPYVLQRRMTFSQTESSSGFGDLILIGQYQSSLNNDWSMKFSGGAKLPTGQVNHQDERGIFLSPDMQSGSGTIDFISRMGILKSHFFIPNLSIDASFLFRKNGTNNSFGDQAGRQFKFGDEWLFNFTTTYQMLIGKSFFVPGLSIKHRRTSANQEQEILSPNSGGQWWTLNGGLSITPNKIFSLRIYSEVPIYQKLSGLQISTNFEAGLQLNFKI